MTNITEMDKKILKKIRSKTVNPKVTPVMKAVTKSGNLGMVWLGIGGGMMLTKKYRKQGLIFCGAVVSASLFNNLVLKTFTGRPRPADEDPEEEAMIRRPFGTSFPSGHTVTAVMAATILTGDNPKFGMFAIPLAAVMSFSRLYLNVHYPTDVAGGALLGFGLGMGVLGLQDKLLSGVVAPLAGTAAGTLLDEFYDADDFDMAEAAKTAGAYAMAALSLAGEMREKLIGYAEEKVDDLKDNETYKRLADGEILDVAKDSKLYRQTRENAENIYKGLSDGKYVKEFRQSDLGKRLHKLEKSGRKKTKALHKKIRSMQLAKEIEKAKKNNKIIEGIHFEKVGK